MFQTRAKNKLALVYATLVAVSIAMGMPCIPDAAADKDPDAPVVIDLGKAKKGKYPIAIPVGVGSDGAAAREVAKIAAFDMGVAGWFRVLDSRSFLADLKAEGLGVVPDKWRSVGAFGVMKYRVTTSGGNLVLKFRLYEVEKGDKPVLSANYTGTTKQLRSLVHKWCNAMVKHYTGNKGFFGSKIAFVTKRRRAGKQVMAMDFDGHGAYRLSRNRSINILPSWSPGGGKVAFTSYMRNNPDLYVVGSGGGRPKRISRHIGMNTGASWSPDGSKIALTLSKSGNPEIYVISASTGKVLRRLTKNRAIDTSPAWSPDGSKIAFVSDREGGPQIFVMSASGGGARRVSMNGSYNTTPTWSPAKGQSVIAYTTRDGGHFDIVTLDLTTRKMVRITQGQGNNEEPSFSPDGRAIAFASVRKGGAGVYIANADGTGTQRRVWRGYATSVDWGPTP